MKINKTNISPGHNACAGCGQLSAVQAVMRALDQNTIIVNATGCLEVTTTAYPTSSWNLPWIHSLFANAAGVASGVRAALIQAKKNNIKVVVQAGDGGTYDIGVGLISGLWERNDRVLYICYDTEAYSNTGIQASGATPFGAHTTTTPSGLKSPGFAGHKKDMLQVALAHGLAYAAQSVSGYPDDISAKVKKALEFSGSTYLQILSPCIPGWQLKSDQAARVGKLAVQTGLYPLLEYENGKLINSSINKSFTSQPVTEYLKIQGRFKHLSKQEINTIQKIADYNIIKYQI